MPVKYFARKVTVKLCIVDFSPPDNRGKKKWTIRMFAPPTAIYTHGPALIMLCIFLKEILLLREFAKKTNTTSICNFNFDKGISFIIFLHQTF